MSAQVDQDKGGDVYTGDTQNIADELDKLDLILVRRIHEFRLQLEAASYTPGNQHLYISSEEVDWLLQDAVLEEDAKQNLFQIDEEIMRLGDRIVTTIENSDLENLNVPLIRLARTFNLSPFEVQVLVICLAPELRSKYDRIYAYLQDDITRRRPSIALVLDLLCRSESERWQLQSLFTKHGNLIQTGLLQVVEDHHSPSGSSNLARFLKLDSRILNYILGNNSLEPRLQELATLKNAEDHVEDLSIDQKIEDGVSRLIEWHLSPDTVKTGNLVIHLYGPPGVGKQQLAQKQAQQLGCRLLCLDFSQLFGYESEAEELLRLAFRDAMLLQSPLYIYSIDNLLGDEYRSRMLTKTLVKTVEEYGWLTFLAGEKLWQAQGTFGNSIFKSIEIPMPDFSIRKKVWQKRLGQLELKKDQVPDDATITQLASQFRLTPGQIKTATDSIRLEHRLSPENVNGDHGDLLDACRNQSNQKLRELAIKIDARYDWKDLILPDSKRALLLQICDQIRQQYKVFNQWGFDEKLAYGKGLSALFSGPPGTGKTMAAQVIANEIQLDLYKVDLSTVISKYIGETEKNLSRIFKEAETSNAILFFDEADALFGKRTEVNDAHDRYANIEVSYLLQKMEEYNGIVVLASNFRVNMDDAFVRRIRFIIEFPFPDEESRKEIWRIHFPERAPVEKDIDYDLLARQFAIPGGNIKNVILNAAFLAAKLDAPIAMEHILEGTRHEYEKIGKLWSAANVQPRNSS